MRRDIAVEEFVQSLAYAELPDQRSVNVYRNVTRCANLKRWLNTFEDTSQSAIFVGEALGRDGGAITGIPFVSPDVLTLGNDPWGEFGTKTGYSMPEDGKPTQKERTATRFWKHVPACFEGLPRPLTWNIFPFWPFQVVGDGRRINRTPDRDEVEFGQHWLVRAVGMFAQAKVVAVGVKARETLESLDIDSAMIPHPSRGSDSGLIVALQEVTRILRS